MTPSFGYHTTLSCTCLSKSHISVFLLFDDVSRELETNYFMFELNGMLIVISLVAHKCGFFNARKS